MNYIDSLARIKVNRYLDRFPPEELDDDDETCIICADAAICRSAVEAIIDDVALWIHHGPQYHPHSILETRAQIVHWLDGMEIDLVDASVADLVDAFLAHARRPRYRMFTRRGTYLVWVADYVRRGNAARRARRQHLNAWYIWDAYGWAGSAPWRLYEGLPNGDDYRVEGYSRAPWDILDKE